MRPQAYVPVDSCPITLFLLLRNLHDPFLRIVYVLSQDNLVQATPENIKVLNEAVVQMQPEGYANPRKALEFGFELLERVSLNETLGSVLS